MVSPFFFASFHWPVLCWVCVVVVLWLFVLFGFLDLAAFNYCATSFANSSS